MTSDPRLDRVEGIVEEPKTETHALRADIAAFRAEINSRLNIHFMVMVGLWATTLAAISGLYFKC